jgi:hypothetical protein
VCGAFVDSWHRTSGQEGWMLTSSSRSSHAWILSGGSGVQSKGMRLAVITWIWTLIFRGERSRAGGKSECRERAEWRWSDWKRGTEFQINPQPGSTVLCASCLNLCLCLMLNQIRNPDRICFSPVFVPSVCEMHLQYRWSHLTVNHSPRRVSHLASSVTIVSLHSIRTTGNRVWIIWTWVEERDDQGSESMWDDEFNLKSWYSGFWG